MRRVCVGAVVAALVGLVYSAPALADNTCPPGQVLHTWVQSDGSQGACHATDGDIYIESADGTQRFLIDTSTGAVTIDGAMEFDSTVGIDGNVRVGDSGASLATITAASGLIHTESDITCGPVAAPLVDIGADGALRLGTAAAPKFTVSTAGAVHQEGGLTVGAVAAPLASLAATGVLRLGTAAAPVFTVDASGNVAILNDLDLGVIATPAMHIDADGSQRWGLAAGPVATMSTAGEFACDGDVLIGPTGADLIHLDNDGSARGGLTGAPVWTLSATGAAHLEGDVTVGPVAAPLVDIGIDGALRLGTAAAPKMTVSTAGAAHLEGDVTIGPVAGPLMDLGIDGALRLGTAAAPKLTVSTAGATHMEGDLTIGPVAGPLADVGIDGALRLGTAAAPIFSVSTAGAVAFDEDCDIGPTGAATVHLDADGSQRWGAGAGVATMSAAGVLDLDGAITTDSTVDGLDLNPTTETSYLGVMHMARGRLDCTGGEVCDTADSPVAFGPTLPDNAVMHQCWYQVVTTITSDTMPADGAVVGIGFATDDVDGIVTPVGHAAGAYTTAIQDGTPTNFSEQLTAARRFSATIGTDNVAAGVVDVYCLYFVGP